MRPVYTVVDQEWWSNDYLGRSGDFLLSKLCTFGKSGMMFWNWSEVAEQLFHNWKLISEMQKTCYISNEWTQKGEKDWSIRKRLVILKGLMNCQSINGENVVPQRFGFQRQPGLIFIFIIVTSTEIEVSLFRLPSVTCFQIFTFLFCC